MNYKQMDGYRLYRVCRLCSEPLDPSPAINLGKMPLAGGFLSSPKTFVKEKLYPLTLAFCSSCYGLQTREVISQDIIFKHYFYFSSAIQTLVEHFQETAKELTKLVKHPKEFFVVEIGCNDGSFLKASQKEGFRVLGIDPAKNVVASVKKESFPIINDFFSTNIAHTIRQEYGKADIIFSANSLAHIEDIQDVFAGIHMLLKDTGICIIEVHDVSMLIGKMQFDMIYHEHQYYYSLHALRNLAKKYDMEVFDVKRISTHGGSLRFYLKQKNGIQKITKHVSAFLVREKKEMLLDKKTYIQYNKRLKEIKKEIVDLLSKIKKEKKAVVGYGASGRGTIFSNYCGLDKKFLAYIVDDAPAKIGTYMPGTHLPIYSSKKLTEINHPHYALLFAWSFYNEILKKQQLFLSKGGKFILPLPTIKILP